MGNVCYSKIKSLAWKYFLDVWPYSNCNLAIIVHIEVTLNLWPLTLSQFYRIGTMLDPLRCSGSPVSSLRRLSSLAPSRTTPGSTPSPSISLDTTWMSWTTRSTISPPKTVSRCESQTFLVWKFCSIDLFTIVNQIMDVFSLQNW